MHDEIACAYPCYIHMHECFSVSCFPNVCNATLQILAHPNLKQNICMRQTKHPQRWQCPCCGLSNSHNYHPMQNKTIPLATPVGNHCNCTSKARNLTLPENHKSPPTALPDPFALVKQKANSVHLAETAVTPSFMWKGKCQQMDMQFLQTHSRCCIGPTAFAAH